MKIVYVGINGLKQHIDSMGGEVSKCFLAIDEERRVYRENLEVMKMKKVDKNMLNEARQEVQILEEREIEDLELSFVARKSLG